MIDWDKPIQQLDGKPAVFLERGDGWVGVALKTGRHKWETHLVNPIFGTIYADKVLVTNIPVTKRLTGCLNVFGKLVVFHPTRAAADENAEFMRDQRDACIEIDIPYKDGEGL